MGKCVCLGAMIKCSFGMTPTALVVSPDKKVINKMPVATIKDSVPVKNIPSFGMCRTVSNPAVASATAAAMGVLTPVPCVPVITAPWMQGSTKVMIGGIPALTNSSKCMCMWGGEITVAERASSGVNL